MRFSIIIPVYKNEGSITQLLDILNTINTHLAGRLEVIFVVDGSPDNSYNILVDMIYKLTFPIQLLAHSRNFGSFAAIRTGLKAANGDYFAVMAADLQEPPELIENFFKELSTNKCDVIIGKRVGRRNDPFLSRLASHLFWRIYRWLVVPEMPEGGVDVFGCNRTFRDQLLRLEESRSSLISLIFWLGFRRKMIDYKRQGRREGKSAWTLNKKLDYMTDSIFAFTNFPIGLLVRLGAIGSMLSLFLALTVIVMKLSGNIEVPGYAATMIAVLFLGALNLFGLGLVGTYAWRTYENSKQRPNAIISQIHKNHE